MKQMFKILLLVSIVIFCQSKCAYYVMANNTPVKTERQPFLIQNYGSCPEYNGQMGCCDQNNDHSQVNSYIEIDGVFGSQGDGCDLCAINLKRFWCQYACSPRQAQYLKVDQGYIDVPDPEKPGHNITVQKVKLTVQAQTACDLYNSCKRVSFVSAVSAMGSPAGFISFQGHNAVDDALQYIDVDFSYSKNNSLWFSDQAKTSSGKKMSPCNYKTNQKKVHGFDFHKNCSCNNCQQSCDNKSGFVYTQADIFEDFNWRLVGGTYIVVLIIAGVITVKRERNKQKKN